MAQTIENTQVKIYQREGIDEYILDEQKALYAAVYDDTGVVRLSNVPINPVFSEDPTVPRGDVPFEVFLTTPQERYWLTHALFEAERETRWFGEIPRQYVPIAPIDQQHEISRLDSPWEHTMILQRTNGEQVSMTVGKRPHPEVIVTVSTEIYENEGPCREQISLSIGEARHLRDLLNAAQLDHE